MNPTDASAVKRRIDSGRMAGLTILFSFASFLLWVFVCDFPEFQSETLQQRVWRITSTVISWPIVVVLFLASVLPGKAAVTAAAVLAVPAFISSGLFWAFLVELIIARRLRNNDSA
jgi:hypothetical protein